MEHHQGGTSPTTCADLPTKPARLRTRASHPTNRRLLSGPGVPMPAPDEPRSRRCQTTNHGSPHRLLKERVFALELLFHCGSCARGIRVVASVTPDESSRPHDGLSCARPNIS